MILAGAMPKLTRSASESSCLPVSECAFSKRAAAPSKKSSTEQTTINTAPVTGWLSKIKTNAMHPVNKLMRLMVFGMFFIQSVIISVLNIL